MKKNNLTRGAFALLLLASTAAGAEQQYPAADFQPEVIYQDSDYIAKNSPTTTTTKAPASTSTASGAAASNEANSKYPAANFQPEVLFHDPNYKPATSVKANASKKEVSSESIESQAVVPNVVKKEESSMSSYLIGLAVLAVAGFYFFKNRGAAPVQKKTSAQAKTSYALTGVAKYINKVSGTGVSRYIEQQVKSASATATTGVAKYMAKQSAASKPTAAKAATGVEKYMRDRG